MDSINLHNLEVINMSLDRMIVYEWTTTEALEKRDEMKVPKPEIKYLIKPAPIVAQEENSYHPKQKDAQYGTYW